MKNTILSGCFFVLALEASAQLFGPTTLIDRNEYGADASELLDMDGDGDLDALFFTNHNGGTWSSFIGWHPNNGNATFGELRVLGQTGYDLVVDFDQFDVDGDSDQDLLVFSQPTSGVPFQWFKLQWFFQVAPGNYVGGPPFGTPFLSTEGRTPAFEDVTGDGFLDVLIDWGGAVHLHMGLPGGQIGPALPLGTNNATADAITIDLDDDGDRDVLVSRENGDFHKFANLGGGVFGPQTVFVTSESSVMRLMRADPDGDGDEDLVCWHLNGSFTWTANDGSGSFGVPLPFIPAAAEVAFKPQFVDADNDGDTDALTSTYSSPSEALLFLNDGVGGFSAPVSLASNSTGQVLAAHLEDMDADGDRDLVFSAEQVMCYAPQLSPGVFQQPHSELTWKVAPKSVASGDLNGDGVLDLVAGGCEGTWYCGLVWYEGNGDGSFSSRNVIDTEGGQPLALGDLDGDGDLDIATGGSTVHFNDGSGSFTQGADLPAYAGLFSDMELGDLDGDGDLDVVMCHHFDQTIDWCMNDGSGNFSGPVLIATLITQPSSISVGDLDNDGDPDLAYGFSNNWRRNNGSGVFSELFLSGTYVHSEPVDMDGDGDLDLLAADPYDGLFWFECNGVGPGTVHPIDSDLPVEGSWPHAADHDLDGDLDIVVASGTVSEWEGILWYEGLGGGTFGTPQSLWDEYIPSQLIGADVDGSGSEDLVFCVVNEVVWMKNYAASPFSVEGRIYRDVDENGAYDPGEPGFPLGMVSAAPSFSYFVGDSSGLYQLNLDSANHVISAVSTGAFWEQNTLPANYSVNLTSLAPMASGLDFGFHPLVDTTTATLSYSSFPALCSQTGPQWITVNNIGTLEADMSLQLVLDTAIAFLSSVPAPSSVIGNTYFWNFPSVDPLESAQIELLVSMPDFSHTGDSLLSTVYTAVLDQFGDTAQFLVEPWMEVVTCAVDPNDKLVTPAGSGFGNYIDMDTEELRYTVRFQNTGNAPAQTVVILDQLDVAVDPTSLTIIGASHAMTTTIAPDRTVAFRFEDILLPDSTNDEPNSHGFVRFSIRLFPGHPEGTVITNQADIFFDVNPAVITNTVYSTLRDCSTYLPAITDDGSGVLVAEAGLSYQWYLNGFPIVGATVQELVVPGNGSYMVEVTNGYGCIALSDEVIVMGLEVGASPTWQLALIPNPARDHVRLIASEPITTTHAITITDMHGRVLRKLVGSGGREMIIGMGGLSQGVYVVSVSGADGLAAVKRVVVE